MADEKSLRTLTTVVYALQAAGFLVVITWIVAVVIDYVKRDEAKGTWLESHFSWQIRTFWWGLLWAVLGRSPSSCSSAGSSLPPTRSGSSTASSRAGST
jgi:uncharacterized membrane protein